MMNVTAYGRRDLQHAAQIMAQCEEAGLTLAECRQALAAEQQKAPVQDATGNTESVVLCPSCGRGALRPVATIEGLRRVGCAVCKYSEVVD